jgi:hypothetical protein
MMSDVCTKKPKKTYKIWKGSHMKVNIKTDFRVICHIQLVGSADTIATSYGLDSVGFESQWV